MTNLTCDYCKFLLVTSSQTVGETCECSGLELLSISTHISFLLGTALFEGPDVLKIVSLESSHTVSRYVCAPLLPEPGLHQT